jgi:cell division transport system permease protein
VRAQFIASEVKTGLRRNLTMTTAVVLTVAVSLGIAFFALLMRRQVDVMKGFWYDKVELSIFLDKDVTQEQRTSLEADLNANPEVAEVFYESSADAYERFKVQFKGSPDLVKNVPPDSLPESFRVKLKNPRNFEIVASEYRGQPGVEQVFNQRELLEKFFTMIGRMEKGAWFIAAAQLIAAVLLISNTIRLAAFSRRRETGIMRLVGASNLYIQLPFLLEGALAGFVGSVFGALLLVGLKLAVVDGLRRAISFTPFVGWGDVLILLPAMFLVGVLLSTLASFVTLRKYLRV